MILNLLPFIPVLRHSTNYGRSKQDGAPYFCQNTRSMKPILLALSGLLFCQLQASSQPQLSRQTYKAVMKLPDSVSINQGSLTLYNLFKIQVRAAYENRRLPEDAFKKAMLDKTYYPYRSFWEGYVGNHHVYFDQVILPLLQDSLPMIENKAALFAKGKIDVFFTQMAIRMQQECGYFPQGKWYLAFGSGVTDMGGFGDGVMVLDLTHHKTTLDYSKFILPHELTHQIFDFTNQEDTTARGLYRCINEGFAVYMNQKLLGPEYELFTYLQYPREAFDFCIQNEATIFTKLKPFLLTSNQEHALALADRGYKVFKDKGPGAIGYFLGYRICEAYIHKNGPDSWKDIFTKPVREILAGSGYDPQ